MTGKKERSLLTADPSKPGVPVGPVGPYNNTKEKDCFHNYIHISSNSGEVEVHYCSLIK